MGRKIPAKKHRGVKDPLVQQAKRLESLKGKINAPPKDPDDQPMPRSVMRLFGLQDPNKKKKQVSKAKPKKTRPEQKGGGGGPLSRLVRAAAESGRDFSLRISSAVRALHSTADDLHYPHDLEAEDVKGQRMAALRERRAAKRRRHGQVGTGARGEAPPLSRTQKLALKKKNRKIEAEESRTRAQQEVQFDRVPFGAVAHAPPSLRPPRAAAAGPAASRPGRRDLLLSKLLEGPPGAGSGPGSRPSSGPGSADAQRRERARLAAIDAYRQLNKAKRKQRDR